MSRISEKFNELREKGEKALIAYIMIGHPTENQTLKTVNGLIKGGVDIIEIGFPFSDPLADGPTIQDASTTSLKKGMTTSKFFKIIKSIRSRTEIPLVLMTYSNILYQKGYHKFLQKAKECGIDGIILPDMPLEEAEQYLRAAKKNKVDTIFLVSPNTSTDRIKKISAVSSGFLYLVAVFGTTGARVGIKDYTIRILKKIKKITKGTIPIGVGFGVSSPQDVKKYVESGADGVIVGSAILRIINDASSENLEDKIVSFTKKLKAATL